MSSTDWTPLRHALARCRSDGIAVPLWWRDDDAVSATPALDRLTALSKRTGVPVHLAIIPAHVDPALASAIDPDCMVPVVHGWAHADHSGANAKKNEFLTPRAGAVDEAQAALDKMITLFGPSLGRMFVPPWNRISDDVSTQLSAQGYRCLSTFGPRAGPVVAGIGVVNTHIDPIWWKGTRDVVDPDHLITRAASHLEARARGAEDAAEPFGLLTHHLVHTPAIWSFAETFLAEMQAGGATLWSMENDR
jgi:hypothetical protein